MVSFTPGVLPSRNPSPPDLTKTSTGCDDLLLVDDIKEPVHRGAIHEIGSLFQREVGVKDTVTRAAHEQDGTLLQ